MLFDIRLIKILAVQLVAVNIVFSLVSGRAVAAEDEVANFAFPDKYMVWIGAYFVEGSRTQFSVSSDVAGLGTVID